MTAHRTVAGEPASLRATRIVVLTGAAALLAGLAARAAGSGGSTGALLLHAGLVCVMATPIVRVISVGIDHARAREWPFAGAALAVLAVLAGTLLAAFLGA